MNGAWVGGRLLIALSLTAMVGAAESRPRSALQRSFLEAQTEQESPQIRNIKPLELALTGRHTESVLGREQLALVQLSVPLERVALTERRQLVALTEQAAPDESALGASKPESRPKAARSDALETEQVSNEPPSLPPAASERALPTLAQTRALSELAERTMARALTSFGVGRDRSRLDSLAARARASALLPELKLRVQRATDQALRWTPTSDDPYRFAQADQAGLTLEASATFRLDRLLFASDELAVERLRIQQAAERSKLERRVLEAVLGVYRARYAVCSGADDALATQLELAALLTELDILTRGWFSRELTRVASALWGELGVRCPALAAGDPAPALETQPVRAEASKGSQRDPSERADNPVGEHSASGVNSAQHACRRSQYNRRPEEARYCAKGVSLTSRL
jgi:hypothetical protein